VTAESNCRLMDVGYRPQALLATMEPKSDVRWLRVLSNGLNSRTQTHLRRYATRASIGLITSMTAIPVALARGVACGGLPDA
jgi:hypothetical protein